MIDGFLLDTVRWFRRCMVAAVLLVVLNGLAQWFLYSRELRGMKERVAELERLQRDQPRVTSDGTVRARRLVIGGP